MALLTLNILIGIVIVFLCYLLCLVFVSGFRWSNVKQPFKKPLLWWYHKVLCELGYFIYQASSNVNEYLMLKGNAIYYKHLHLLCKKGYNLYGDKI